MKKKTIILEKEETVEFETLTDREKQVFEAGRKSGVDQAGKAFLIIMTAIIITVFLAFWKAGKL